ncbi:arsenate reductase (glutaredoxin) [Planctomycetales bacterium ZRK34]|nr:arsenate reductase (glutaredoxin) [Planctomycetales bacterium ZRK34]
MSDVTIYHNPRCSKSRQTLALLRERDIEPRVVEYLNHPPTAVQLKKIIKQLGMPAKDIIRRREKPFAELKLSEKLDDDAALIAAMVEHPILIERPIVVTDKGARIGRPPESVLEVL